MTLSSASTTFTTALAGMTDAIAATKAEITTVEAAISAKDAERRRIATALPHTDDIVAVFTRGIAANTGQFNQLLTSTLREYFGGQDAPKFASPQSIQHLLTIEARKPTAEQMIDRSLSKEAPQLSMIVLSYLLRDKIATELPALVATLFPASKDGMKQADRATALAAIDDELTTLRTRLAALVADLAAARATVGVR